MQQADLVFQKVAAGREREVSISRSLLFVAVQHLWCWLGSARWVVLALTLLGSPPLARGSAVPAEPDSLSIRIDRLLVEIRRAPASAPTRVRLAEAYLERGNLVAARAAAEEGLRLGLAGEDSTRAILLLVGIALRQDRVNDARVRLQNLARRRNAPPDALARLAQIWWDDHFEADALVLGMAALSQDPGDARKRRWLAERWKETGRLDLALALVKALCKNGTATDDDLFQVGYLSQRLGKEQEAADAYATLLTRSPMHPEANYNLALLLLGASDTVSATEHLERVLHATPLVHQAYFDLALLYMRRGRVEDARRTLLLYCLTSGADPVARAEAGEILRSISDAPARR